MNDPFAGAKRLLNELKQQTKVIEAVVEAKAAELREFERLVDLAGLNTDLFQMFLQKPYLLRRIAEDRFELVLPKFMAKDFHPGWPLGEEGEYIRFGVSKLTHLLQPLPDWLLNEIDFKPAGYDGFIEGDRLTITEGDPAEAWQALGGKKAFTNRRGNVLSIRPKSKFQLFRDLVRQGILPYRPAPVSPHLLYDKPRTSIVLRPAQERDYEIFLKWGGAAVIAPGGAGKTFFGLYALAHFKGAKLVLAPRTAILDQWKARLQAFAPQIAKEVEFKTYQWLRHAKKTPEYGLVVYDEIQTLPSNSGLLAAQLRSKARLGLSATPWREDGQEDLIIALSGGIPLGVDWPTGEAPRTVIWISANELEKEQALARIMTNPVEGKTMIFVNRLAVGERLASLLKVPFVNGSTPRQLEVMRESPVVIVSKVADAGVSFPDVRRVIEVDRLGGRTELGQRGLRLGHADGRGEFHVLMTREEYRRFAYRLSALYALKFDDVQVIGG